jgi:galactokinase
VTARRYRSPGRVNLIGGHVDYHQGVVVTMAIDRGIDAEVTARDDGLVTVASDAFPDSMIALDLSARVDIAAISPDWGRTVGGVIAAMAEAGHEMGGFDAVLRSSLPVGAGLSSSASLGVLLGMIASDLGGAAPDPRELAALAQRAEHLASGVECGIQDPTAIVVGGTIRLDCRDLSVEPVAIPDGTSVVVIDSGVRRSLVDSPWTARRTESFDQASEVGVNVLRDASAKSVAELPRARHVVSEIARAEAFAGALNEGDIATAGALMLASHESSRDDFESSIVELDHLVLGLVDAGAYGARLTGGGFGGCVVALVPTEVEAEIVAAAVASFRSRFDRDARAIVVEAAPGAGLTSL